ncbi:MAG: rhodanese-like domain-containing protein [Zetaproteobacteria bacterium]|nr:MAG: rhodanese-like domain-containing protein [Zetaproteobacteria bacterium]
MLREISVDELYPRWLIAREKGEPLLLFDVRTAEEFAVMHVPGARLLPLAALPARMNEIPGAGEVYVMCQAGARSAQACVFLRQRLGYEHLVNIRGGMLAWQRAGYPVAQGGEQ